MTTTDANTAALSAAPPPAARSAARDPAWQLTAVAGLMLAVGLAAALAGARSAAFAVTAGGAAAALFVLVPRGVAAIGRQPALLLGLLAPLTPFVLVFTALGLGATTFGIDGTPLVALGAPMVAIVLVLLVAGGGVVLLAEGLRGSVGGRRSPWERLSGASPVDGPVRPGRAVAGLGLVGLAGVLGLALADTLIDTSGLSALLLLVLVGAGAIGLVAAPVAIAGVAGADRSRVDAVRDDERQRVAAHLHDSVLQTLALIQRQAHDPAAVARLARGQEHALRTWMAGEAELGADTLASALRTAVAEVEDDHGVAVEITVLGDRPLDPAGEALAAAAREALRNAARHAPGARIYVFAQIARDGVEAFVRDEGPGFTLADIPTGRRGVRDAIIGRMTAAGGRATVESAPGDGTEVALRIGRL